MILPRILVEESNLPRAWNPTPFPQSNSRKTRWRKQTAFFHQASIRISYASVLTYHFPEGNHFPNVASGSAGSWKYDGKCNMIQVLQKLT
jgi:hypothetical protein